MSSLRGGGQYRDLAPSEDLSEFASAIATMTKNAQKDNSEEFQKNVIAQFLSTTFGYDCNTHDKVDLAIYDDDIPKVLFEVKSLSNKAEFVKTPDLSLQRQSQNRSTSSLRGNEATEAIQKTDTHPLAPSAREGESLDCYDLKSPLPCGGDLGVGKSTQRADSRNDKWGLESKALYESILYYLREWHKHKNNDIKHIILCTAKEFYIIKATEYHRLFAKNKDIERAYNNCDFKEGNDTSTAQFYKQVETIIKDIDGQLEFYYINVESALNNQNDLALFYALLSPSVLLQIPRYIDANTLNERFYKELLYILGLVQVEQNGKAVILPNTTPNTLLHSIKRDFADKLPRESSQDSSDSAQSHKGDSTQNPSHPQDSHNSADIFDSHIFPLIMLWNNRILFLRLLESMLLSFRHIEKPFLDISILRDFGALNTLFFKVLAVKNRADIPQNLANIPYLNSSLFEKSALESQGFEIASLESRPLKIAPDSILRRDKTLREKYICKDDSLPLLEYLFAFLHAYDFTTTPSDVQNYAKTNHDKLINSAVLGLVFEKLNGYKEGSFYTPSFITRYMCESSIRKIVVEKFQECGFKAQSLIALRNEIDINKLNDANKIFLSIRICDPAVGSGHFLVSALNELIAIKHELGLLLDCDGRRLSDIDLALENDELLIKDSQGKMLDYAIPAHEGIEAHKIQKAIFYTKKELIENCLFGVDINPNSVEICKLRLWIELLKYSYYENIASKELQTLPNIDINIKCGNSLVSLFELNESDENGNPKPYTLKWLKNQNSEFSQNFREKLLRYNDLVQTYKEKLGDKQAIAKEIESIKSYFKTTLLDNSFVSKQMKDKLKNFIEIYGDEVFDIGTPFGMEMIKISRNNGMKFIPKIQANKDDVFEYSTPKEIDNQGQKLLDSIKADFDNIQSIKEQQTFEWRFEFPEVLDLQSLQSKQEKAKLHNAKKRAGQNPTPNELDSIGDFMGFDLIIGNPPYIRQEEIKELKPHLQKSFYIYCGTGDIYTYFYERGHSLLKLKGILTLITSNKFCRAGYGANLRAFLLQSAILDFVDLNGVKVFDKATVDTCIVNLSKQKPTKSHALNYANPNAKDLSTISYSQIPQDSLSSEAFIFVDSPTLALKQKIERIGTPLKEWDIEIYRGVLTGYNEAFIIDTATRDGILDSCESVAEKERTAQIIKPILRGRDIKRYSYEWAGLWLIFLSWHFPNTQNPKSMDENEKDLAQLYPSLYRHLLKHKDNLSKRNKAETGIRYEWYCMQRYGANYYEDFEKEKISWQRVTQEPSFILEKDFYLLDSMAFLVSDSKQELRYLLAFLNSKVVFWYFKNIGHLYSDKGFLLSNQYVAKFPIPKINAKNQKIADKIVNLVDKVLESKAQGKDSTTPPYPNATPPCHTTSHPCHTERSEVSQKQKRDFSVATSLKNDRDFSHSTNAQNDNTNKSQYDNTSDLESQIDTLVYQLYDLDSSEIQIIEST